MTTVLSTNVAVGFLERAFEPGDWVAVFLKTYDTGRVLQRVAPVSLWRQPRWQLWLRVMNAHRFNVYVSVNALMPGCRDRTKTSVRAVRHVFLDVDQDAGRVLQLVAERRDLPDWSSVIRSSPGRAQVLWRVTGLTPDTAEGLQKQLARELGGDRQATSASQTMRLPGFENWKYTDHPVVTVEYGTNVVNALSDFPPRNEASPALQPAFGIQNRPVVAWAATVVTRARHYLAAVPAAVAGEGGDSATFRVCCRLARGFSLGDNEALSAIAEWNQRCQPPWTDAELIAKLQHARRYGKEPIGGLFR